MYWTIHLPLPPWKSALCGLAFKSAIQMLIIIIIIIIDEKVVLQGFNMK